MKPKEGEPPCLQKNTAFPLEYSRTPLYNSCYIEDIRHLYAPDRAQQPGWMYKVNGWFSNYGCHMEDGNAIVRCCTCNGLGGDVGGGNW